MEGKRGRPALEDGREGRRRFQALLPREHEGTGRAGAFALGAHAFGFVG